MLICGRLRQRAPLSPLRSDRTPPQGVSQLLAGPPIGSGGNSDAARASRCDETRGRRTPSRLTTPHDRAPQWTRSAHDNPGPEGGDKLTDRCPLSAGSRHAQLSAFGWRCGCSSVTKEASGNSHGGAAYLPKRLTHCAVPDCALERGAPVSPTDASVDRSLDPPALRRWSLANLIATSRVNPPDIHQ